MQRLPSTPSRRRASSRRRTRSWYARLGTTIISDNARFLALVLFMGLVALTGGGSRSDIQSLILLRPAAVLFTFYALMVGTMEQFREVRAPLMIIAAFMALALLQLMPLPAAFWSKLAHGDLIARASMLAGIDIPPRPLSLDPGRTWNTLFALFVPLGAVCLIAVQAPAFRRRIVPSLVAVAFLSAVFGFLQAIGGEKLHLYAITHKGYPVGLFANKNHQAVMLVWSMLAASWLAANAAPRQQVNAVAVGGALTLILILMPLLILTGSRAGLALSVPAVILSGWLLLRAPATTNLLQLKSVKKKKLIVGGAATAMAAPLVFAFGVLLLSDRQTAISRLFSGDPSDDLRWSILPISLQMARDFLPFGSGFGSFEKAFNLYEPSEMLTSRYVNQAHNDLVQIVVEGGLPALALLVVSLIWLVRTVWRLRRSSRSTGPNLAIFFGGSMFLWLAASLVDYPLRTPLAALVIASLTAWASTLSNPALSSSGGSGRQK